MGSLIANGRLSGNMKRTEKELYRSDITRPGPNGTAGLGKVGRYVDEDAIIEPTFGYLELIPEEIPKKFEFVMDSYPKVFFDNIKTGIRKKGKIKGPYIGAKKGLSKMGTKFFYTNSHEGKAIIDEPGGWEAVHLFSLEDPQTPLDAWMENRPVVKGIVQRYKLFEEKQKKAAYDRLERKGRIDHLELFGGSLLTQLKVYEDILKEGNVRENQIKLLAIDQSPDAKKEAEAIAQEKGISSIMDYNVDRVENSPQILKGNWGIISSSGGFDHYKDEKIIDITRELSKFQEPGDYYYSTNMLRIPDHWDWLSVILIEGPGGFNSINYRSPGRAGELIKGTGMYDVESFIATPNGHYKLNGSSRLKKLFNRNAHEFVEGRRKDDPIILE